MVVFGKVIVFGKKGCIRARLLYSGKSCYIPAKLRYSGKVVAFGLWLYSGKSGFIRGKIVVFGQKWLYSRRVVDSGQK